jgi:nitrite reductase/ring-hydroxylating ferredoxin subunit
MNYFRKSLWGLLLLAGGLLVLAFTRMLFLYAMPLPNEVLVGKLSNFPSSSAPYLLREERLFYLVNTGNELIALSSRTPHGSFRHCLLRWDAERQVFSEPCGGSRFNLDGSYQFGPAPRDMDRHPVIVKEGKVWVNVRREIEGTYHR